MSKTAKRHFYQYPEGSAMRVLAHFAWRKKRGRLRPTMAYKDIRNPEKALMAATNDAAAELDRLLRKTIMEAIDDSISQHPDNRNSDTSFEVIIGLETIARFPTFESAYERFYNEIKKTIMQGTTYMVVETANFIKHTVKTPHGPIDCVLDFFQARDLAYTTGILDNGQLIKPPPKVPSYLVDLYFLSTEAENRNIFLRMTDAPEISETKNL